MVSWIMFGSEEQARLLIVETHDKFGCFLVVFGLIHLISRSGRMIRSIRKGRVETMLNKNMTKYIRFDPGKCNACWKCIEACPNDVLGKINILLHKHMNIGKRDNCIGCLRCIKACSHRAIMRSVMVEMEVVDHACHGQSGLL